MTFKMRPMMFIVAVLLIHVVSQVNTLPKKHARLHTDSVSKTRCDLLCYEARSEGRAQCRSVCRITEEKPGTCPAASSSDSPDWDQACVEACDSDSQCEGTQKCCRQGCGYVCDEPNDLLYLPGLPPLPTSLDIKEKRRSVLVKWSSGVGDSARNVPGKVLYLIEEQHHLGPKYEELRLGRWNFLLRTNKTKVTLRNVLKPGRWYRFRVAAVSSAGTRGFSLPSSPFTPRKGPRSPPPPKSLKVRPLQAADDGTITVRLEWKEPKSDLPVMRYKVFWSRRVRGLNGELDSVLVNHHTVSKDQHFMDIRDLEPNSMYFFQVQTISQYGNGKLRSEKCAVFYNTTGSKHREKPPPPPPPEALSRRPVKERLMKDRPETERPGKERPEKERPEKEHPEKKRLDIERPDTERPETERPERQRPEKDRSEKERPENDRPAKERTEKERPVKERPVNTLLLKERPMNELVIKERIEQKARVTGLRLLTYVWTNYAIKGKIAWNPIGNDNKTKYFVHWQTVKCPDNIKEYHHTDLSAITQKTVFEIYEIDFECTYQVNVNQSWDTKSPESEIFLTVPSIDYIEGKIKKSQAEKKNNESGLIHAKYNLN